MPAWRKLSHENILPFHGVNMTLFQLALVYDWGQNGNITQYVASRPGVSRSSLVRTTQLPRRLRVITNPISLIHGSCLMPRRGYNTFIRLISHMGI